MNGKPFWIIYRIKKVGVVKTIIKNLNDEEKIILENFLFFMKNYKKLRKNRKILEHFEKWLKDNLKGV
jgi:ribosomal protein L1